MFEQLAALKQGALEADLNPTENPARLVLVVQKIFPDAELKQEDNKLVGTAGLEHFQQIIASEKVRKTICDVLDRNALNGKSFVSLNKLAASVGKIGIEQDFFFPLGSIRLFVNWEKQATQGKKE